MKKPKKKTTSQLKKELDRLFSLYIRNKYAKNGYVNCYTCGVAKTIKEIQCGHFVSRSHLNLRFDERNCRPQCVGCNIFGNGNTAEFGYRLNNENAGIVNQLYKEAQKITKDYPYEKEIEKYKELVKKISTP